MSDRQTSQEHANQNATDSEIFAVLRRVKEEDGIPVLVTSQFNDIWEHDYSNEGLHKRLVALHEDGILGHMKASNRHIWWLSSEGDTGETSISSLEDLVRYNDLSAENFSEEKAQEIAAENIPGFEKNAWERMIDIGDQYMRAGIITFFVSLGAFAIEQSFVPLIIFAFVFLVGLVLITLSGGYYLVGFVGTRLHNAGKVSEEPFEKKSAVGYLLKQLQ